VLLLTDPVDEVWVDMVDGYDGKNLQSIAKGQVELDPVDEAVQAQREEDFGPLLTWMTGRLAEQVKQVRLSSRLTTSPACVVADADDLTPALARMYRAMGQEVPPFKRILELNPTHPLVNGLRGAYAERGDDDALAEVAELLYGTALLAEGDELADPARFAKLVADRLEKSL
jgi:molecular chaperone HtpG